MSVIESEPVRDREALIRRLRQLGENLQTLETVARLFGRLDVADQARAALEALGEVN